MLKPFDETPINDETALAKKHFESVEGLKKSLVIGQYGFLGAGKFLTDIRESESYKYEDASREVTWNEFISRPDIPIPGSTLASRIRTAQTIMRVYDTFKKQRNIEDDRLAEIGYTKLDLVARELKEHPEKDVEELLESAKTLSVIDLSANMTEKEDCKHEELKTFKITKCSCCHSITGREEIKD